MKFVIGELSIWEGFRAGYYAYQTLLELVECNRIYSLVDGIMLLLYMVHMYMCAHPHTHTFIYICTYLKVANSALYSSNFNRIVNYDKQLSTAHAVHGGRLPWPICYTMCTCCSSVCLEKHFRALSGQCKSQAGSILYSLDLSVQFDKRLTFNHLNSKPLSFEFSFSCALKHKIIIWQQFKLN